MLYQVFSSPQVKRCVVITYKHGIYELPQELPNDSRLRILGKYLKFYLMKWLQDKQCNVIRQAVQWLR